MWLAALAVIGVFEDIILLSVIDWNHLFVVYSVHLFCQSSMRSLLSYLALCYIVIVFPGILETMMNNGMKIEAVDVASTFGIEDKFPPQKLLTSFLQDAKEASKRRRREANNSPYLMVWAILHLNLKYITSS